ncbi:hypothetical protein [Hungatella hathewayi]|uniref:hypothetical protein n=1 Tax=Hungatella hathewayi TaxID=154046 RepID=UPI00356B01DD
MEYIRFSYRQSEPDKAYSLKLICIRTVSRIVRENEYFIYDKKYNPETNQYEDDFGTEEYIGSQFEQVIPYDNYTYFLDFIIDKELTEEVLMEYREKACMILKGYFDEKIKLIYTGLKKEDE